MLTLAHSVSLFRSPYEHTTSPVSLFAYVKRRGHITNGSESMTTPAKSHAVANSIAPCKLPALTSLTGTEPALLMRRIGKVRYLHANATQISGLKDEIAIFRLPQRRKIMVRMVST